MENLGGGIAALAFWGFVATAVVAGIWGDIRKRDAEHETLRRLIDQGTDKNQEQIDKILSKIKGGNDNIDRDLRIGGLITLFLSPGLALFGWILGMQSPKAFMPLLGVSALVFCISLGLLTAAYMVKKYKDN